ncbi:MAG: hypothetical protein IPL54_01135 [Chitinophagaceae bacterium]|nr:hypothetical protein [Chitinophagaceae bacterium]
MKIKAFILILFAGALCLNACQKDVDVFVPDPGQLNGPDTSWQNTITASMPVSILKSNLSQQPVYLDSITVNANIATVNTPLGIQVNFPPNCCTTGAGQPVTGKVQVEIMAIKKKGDMIRLNKPSTWNDSMLVTAGQIFIQLKKEGQVLQLAPGIRINIRYIDLPVNNQMKFFIGDETNAQRFNWLPTPTPSLDTIIMGTQQYEIYTRQQRWISIATLFDVNIITPKVRVSADIAPYFTNANTVAFTVFKDVRSVVAMQGDLNTRKFITGKLPVGKQVTVVVISKQAGDYYLGFESAVTQSPAANVLTQLVRVVPIKKSLPEIFAYLSTL